MHTFLPLALLPVLATAAPNPPIPIPYVPHRSLAEFEERFVDSLPYTLPNTTSLRLVGYKTISIPAHEAPHFETEWASRLPADWNARAGSTSLEGDIAHHFYYDAPARQLRVYFPVEGALLSASGSEEQLVEADHLGQLTDSRFLTDAPGSPPCHVVGRKQTAHVGGVDGNVVRDGVIYLSTPAQPVRRVGERTYLYDFGAKVVHEHAHGKRDDHEDGKGSCLQNHNGENCSKAYKIDQKKCKMDWGTCMDYNGYVTDCKKGTTEKFGIPTLSKVVKFVGSDCSVSVARGHCWNEIM